MALLELSWDFLGPPPLAVLGLFLGPLWSLLLQSWGILGPFGGHLEATLGILRRKSRKSSKMQPLPHEMLILLARTGPRWLQEGILTA